MSNKNLIQPIDIRQPGMAQNPVLNAVPVRIQRSRQHKQVSPNGLPVVYVGRPSMWGNPFKLVGDMVYVDASHRRKILSPWVLFMDGGGHTADHVVKIFRSMMMDLNSWPVEEPIYNRFRLMRDRIKDLQDKNLSCWCPLGCKCHADILIEIANW